MRIISCIIGQKRSAELKKAGLKINTSTGSINGNTDRYLIKQPRFKNIIRTVQNESGGGLGTIFLGLAAMLLAFVVFINIVDYSLFTYKRNAISKAMDYAVTAAVQQVDKSESKEGLSYGFSEDTGEKVLEDIEIDIGTATETFLKVLYANWNPEGFGIAANLLVCTTSAHDNKLSYIIKVNPEGKTAGIVESCTSIEDKINQAIGQKWPDSEDNSRVYINGNPKTNMLVNGTYLLAFIKDIKVTGVYSQRKISLSSFAGAKIERQSKK